MFYIFRPHRNTTYIDAAYCYRPTCVVHRSVRLSVWHSHEPCRNGQTNRDAIWVAHIDASWQIQLNRPMCGGDVAFSRLLWPLVNVYLHDCPWCFEIRFIL